MKQLLNTLFVTSEDMYLSLDGENVVASRDRQEIARYPLHTLSGITSFAYPRAWRLCPKGHINVVLHTSRALFGSRLRGEQWERTAPSRTVSAGG